jgi:glycosyltransferase involved in cell wall biosynthesis
MMDCQKGSSSLSLSIHWAILTGEYPPQPGGVSDYTKLVAHELERRGDTVEVWPPPSPEAGLDDAYLGIHRLPDRFGAASRRELSLRVARMPAGARLLVQYVPQAYGWKGMNLPFCFWLWRQRRRHPIDLMFHEVATPWGKGVGLAALRKHVLAIVTRFMAMLVARSAENIYVSIPAWVEMLKGCVSEEKMKDAQWLPVPSTIPHQVDWRQVDSLRQNILARLKAESLIGHFGTFGSHVGAALRQVLPETLKTNRFAALVLVGRGSRIFADELVVAWPELRERILAIGAVEPAMVSHYLAACDCLVQPYADGISGRRTSAMAGLALGRPIVTTFGFLSEPLWKEGSAVRLVNSFGELPGAIGGLLADAAERARLGNAAAALYRQHFNVDRTIDILRSRATCRSSNG